MGEEEKPPEGKAESQGEEDGPQALGEEEPRPRQGQGPVDPPEVPPVDPQGPGVHPLGLPGRVEAPQEPDPAPLAQEVVLQPLHLPPAHPQMGQDLVPPGKPQGKGKPIPAEVQPEPSQEGVKPHALQGPPGIKPALVTEPLGLEGHGVPRAAEVEGEGPEEKHPQEKAPKLPRPEREGQEGGAEEQGPPKPPARPGRKGQLFHGAPYSHPIQAAKARRFSSKRSRKALMAPSATPPARSRSASKTGSPSSSR